jgi:hypothetical protein
VHTLFKIEEESQGVNVNIVFWNKQLRGNATYGVFMFPYAPMVTAIHFELLSRLVS